MKRRALAATVIALLLPVATSVAQQTRFTSGVDLVRVDALVTDGRHGITGLTSDDFELRDNGVLQTIDAIAIESLPLTVTFVLDTSGSVAGDKMVNLASAVDIVLKGMRRAGSRGAGDLFASGMGTRAAHTGSRTSAARR